MSQTAAIEIRAADPACPTIAPLIEASQEHGADQSTADSDHTLGVAELCKPGVLFFAAYQGEQPLGCGAIKTLRDGSAEVKSVFVSTQARGQGLARQIMDHLAAVAGAKGFAALVLETGSPLCPGYDAARSLYERLGYQYCPPFEGYKTDPLSVFMRLPLTPAT
ncbi:GNAT family N-acetyltransferase [Pseudophaeobacter leonis]|uniref:GNAT family N-acetyltransferase n=1 Tax=Pseudophaeobacter leonis TaxID=1144477 RepID=UPI0009F3210D|nr:GNAT family N-acetyltransferase [Pseudophaeobacter leonis]